MQLTCVGPLRLPLLHGFELRELLRWALGVESLPAGLIPFAPESGQLDFSAGDRYGFGVTAIGAGRVAVDRLLLELSARLPARGQGEGPRLATHCRLHRAWPLPPPQAQREIEALAELDSIDLRFLSPLRLHLPRKERRGAGRWVSEQTFPAQLLLTETRRRVAQALGWTDDVTRIRLPAHGLKMLPRPAVRLPLTLGSDGDAKRRISGIQGRLHLHGLPSELLPLIVAARYLHVGQAIPLGFGRFDLPDLAPIAPEPWRASTSLGARVAEPGRLARAADLVLAGGPAGAAASGSSLVGGLARTLSRGDYAPVPMRSRTIPKPSGGVRQLAIPSVPDRIVQRAALDLLAPILDGLFADVSFGFRRGRSRFDAARTIAAGWRQGERTVLDADIEAFFDNVPWPRLLARLDALFPRDPIVDLLASWITCPVRQAGRRIQRLAGITQGSPISPLLANFVLDELDSALLASGARLVRYADDFAVLCRNDREAGRRLLRTEHELMRLGLRLNVDKTEVRAFTAGWTFLGFVICGSLILPRTPSRAPALG
ncbi:MAG: hypothetical protein F9K16_03000 [Thermoanaerobaculia bacterium]|nr:MAG: hypothetical protein F9K16_03000 [Thermoanaerobaculia bacterium]MBZ0102116.1 hypothetical protein [Thermoanaerobaculia bacterium]